MLSIFHPHSEALELKSMWVKGCQFHCSFHCRKTFGFCSKFLIPFQKIETGGATGRRGVLTELRHGDAVCNSVNTVPCRVTLLTVPCLTLLTVPCNSVNTPELRHGAVPKILSPPPPALERFPAKRPRYILFQNSGSVSVTEVLKNSQWQNFSNFQQKYLCCSFSAGGEHT